MKNILDSCLHFGKRIVCVDSSASFTAVCTKLISEDVSYLPVIDNNNTKNVAVYSRKDIFHWLYANSPVNLTDVKINQFKKPSLPFISSQTTFLEITQIIESNSAVLFRNEKGEFTHYISPRVVANILHNYSKGYILIEELELTLRKFLIFKKIDLESIRIEKLDKPFPKTFDLLDFGQYTSIISKCWDILDLNYDKKQVLNLMNKAQRYRNALMHFRPYNETDELEAINKLKRIFIL